MNGTRCRSRCQLYISTIFVGRPAAAAAVAIAVLWGMLVRCISNLHKTPYFFVLDGCGRTRAAYSSVRLNAKLFGCLMALVVTFSFKIEPKNKIKMGMETQYDWGSKQYAICLNVRNMHRAHIFLAHFICFRSIFSKYVFGNLITSRRFCLTQTVFVCVHKRTVLMADISFRFLFFFCLAYETRWFIRRFRSDQIGYLVKCGSIWNAYNSNEYTKLWN